MNPRHLEIALMSLLVFVSALYLLRPIMDEDFFWHLKTGEWIVEHRHLPESDPFSYTGSAIATTVSRFTLTSYWVCQVLFHFTFALSGFIGIVLLRLLLAAALFAVTWKRLRCDGVVRAALLVVFAVVFLEGYCLERPQVLSFICFGALLLLLDNIRGTAGGRRLRPSLVANYRGPLLVALVMLFWANVHGGFVLGQATIAVYLGVEGLKFAHRSLRPMGRDAYRSLLMTGGAGLIASLANPNTYHALEMFVSKEGPEGQRVLISEYLSTMAALTLHKEYIVVVVWALMLLAILAVASKPREIDITEAFLVAGSSYYAFEHLRYVPIFMIVALPLTGRFLSQVRLLRWSRISLVAAALALALFFAQDERNGLWRLRTGEWVERAEYPVEAADFILASNLSGNMYNFYNWGGYLIWRLAPERKVFVDGRNINPGIHWQALVINLGFEQGSEFAWKPLLDQYGVRYVLIPGTYGGKRFLLFDRLLKDPDWTVLFNKSNSAIFARKFLTPGENPPPESPAEK